MKVLKQLMLLLTIFSLVNVQARNGRDPSIKPMPQGFMRDFVEYNGKQHAKRIETIFRTGRLDLVKNIPPTVKKNLEKNFSYLKEYSKDISKIKVTFIAGSYFVSFNDKVTYFQVIDAEKMIVKVQGKKIRLELNKTPEEIYEHFFVPKKKTTLMSFFIEDAHAVVPIVIAVMAIAAAGSVVGCVMFCNKTGSLPGDVDGYLSHVTSLKNKCESDTRELYSGNVGQIDEALTAASEIDKIMDEAKEIFEAQGRFATDFEDVYSCEQLTWAHMSKFNIIRQGLESVGDMARNGGRNEFVEKTQRACNAYKETFSCLENLSLIAQRNGLFNDQNRRRYHGYLYGTYAGEYEGYVEDVRRAMENAAQQ